VVQTPALIFDHFSEFPVLERALYPSLVNPEKKVLLFGLFFGCPFQQNGHGYAHKGDA
jgi:hypothetical protein